MTDLVEYLRTNLADVEAPDYRRRIGVAKRVRTEFGIPDLPIVQSAETGFVTFGHRSDRHHIEIDAMLTMKC